MNCSKPFYGRGIWTDVAATHVNHANRSAMTALRLSKFMAKPVGIHFGRRKLSQEAFRSMPVLHPDAFSFGEVACATPLLHLPWSITTSFERALHLNEKQLGTSEIAAILSLPPGGWNERQHRALKIRANCCKTTDMHFMHHHSLARRTREICACSCTLLQPHDAAKNLHQHACNASLAALYRFHLFHVYGALCLQDVCRA